MRYDVAMSVSALTPSPSSTRPYLIRALYEWCTDNGYTPYIAAYVDDSVQVPREHVKNNEIVLNISMDATSSLKLGNEFVEFKARFSGSAREIMVPIDRVIAIYARENGQGMAFPVPQGIPPRGEVAQSEPRIHAVDNGPPSAVSHLNGVSSDTASAPNQSSTTSPNSPNSPRVVQLVTATAPHKDDLAAAPEDSAISDAQDPNEPPELPPSGAAPSGTRPSLKRVK
jgi:stringent starvation protein B